MKKFSLILLVFAAIVLGGCGGSNPEDEGFVIKGQFTNSKGDSIFLDELKVSDFITLDSTVISEDGDFYFKVKRDSIGFYRLRIKSDNFVMLLIDKGETVDITADARQILFTYKVSGSKGSELIWELNTHKKENWDKVDSLEAVYKASLDKPDFTDIKESIDSTYKLIFNDEKEFVKSFIDKNVNSLACLIAIYEEFGREPLFAEKDSADFVYFEKLDKALTAAYPGNIHAEDLHARIAEIKRVKAESELAESKLAIGNEAPDFTMESSDGKSVKLSSFRDKYLLLAFWASYHTQSRKDNAKLVALYKKYKGDYFTMLSVSFDQNKSNWTSAIKKDKLTWTQVSDLQYPSSPVAKLYNVQDLPYYILLDKDGKILAKSTDFEVMEGKVEEALK